MKSFTYTIVDPLGIHARPAGLLARQAKCYPDTVITVEKGERRAKATQLMMLMGMGIRQGDEVKVSAEGGAENEAIAAIQDFFKANL